MKKIITLLCAVATLTACDIDRLPYGSMSAEQITQDPTSSLESLVNGCYAQLKSWSDPMHRLGEYAGDNMAKDKSSTDAFFDFISYSRDADNYRLQSFWDSGYKAIAQASNIIKMIDEGQSKTIDYQLGECYYIRGMMYFYLGRAFGRPYWDKPEGHMGVPIVNGTPDDVNNLNLPDRSTVQDTYEQAIDDLKAAARLMENGETKREGPAYASKEAAWAMLSRIYLFMSGTYEAPNSENAQLAIDYATKVIESTTDEGGLKYELLSRENFMRYNTFMPENNKESIFVVKIMASEKPDYWNSIGGMYSYAGQQGWGEMYASAKYMDLLNEQGRNDWRPDKKKIVDARANFISPSYITDSDGKYVEVFRFIKNVYNKNNIHTGYTYVQLPVSKRGDTVTCKEGETNYTLSLINSSEEKYSISYSDGQIYHGVIDYEIELSSGQPKFYILKCSNEGTASGEAESQLHSPVISRLGKVYLNRAEAYAKKGDYPHAQADLNIIRERSLPGGGYNDLNASNAKARIEKERQLELAYQAERSYDVFRNCETLTRKYPGVHDAMLEIPATDYRVIYFIPQSAINSYPGTLTQNPTSN